MNFQALATTAEGLAKVAADALLVIVPAPTGDAPASIGEPTLDAALTDALEQGDFALKAGRTLYLHRLPGMKAPRVVLAAARDASPKAVRAALNAAFGALKGRLPRHVAAFVVGAGADAALAESLVLAADAAGYTYTATKPSADVGAVPAKVSLLCAKAELAGAKAALAQAQAIAAGIGLARACANLPANVCTPTYLGQQAAQLGETHGLEVEVLERKAIEKLGMGAFLAVAQGAEEPPRFIVIKYQGAGKKEAPVVLVGKGITFDTGGISLKPAAEMDEMKFDMCGAASVLGTMRAVAEIQPKLNVIALIPTCENMPSGRATRPGDVVTSLSGKTIEILNTDAEGRLILCDALTYAERFKPAAVVDVATLTGACIIALGHHQSGLFASDDALAEQLLTASRTAQDPCWRLPLDEEYDDALKSNFADMANVGARAGGAITAAKFLQRFTAAYPWAHLDIAGVGHRGGANKGATGRPVALLTHFVLARAGA